MGSDQSTNETDIVVNDVLNIYTSSTLDQSASAGCINEINLTDCSINNFDSTQDCYVKLNTEGIQDGSVQTDAQQTVNEQVDQIAETISQNLNLNPDSTDATNVTKSVTNLTTTITNDFNTNCDIASLNENVINCTGSSIGTAVIEQNTVADLFNKCVQNSDAINNAKQSLEETISQTSTVKIKNALSIYFIFLMVIIVAMTVVISVTIKTTGSAAGAMKWVILAIVIAIIGFLIMDCFVTKLVICKSSSSSSGGGSGGSLDISGNDNVNLSASVKVDNCLINNPNETNYFNCRDDIKNKTCVPTEDLDNESVRYCQQAANKNLTMCGILNSDVDIDSFYTGSKSADQLVQNCITTSSDITDYTKCVEKLIGEDGSDSGIGVSECAAALENIRYCNEFDNSSPYQYPACDPSKNTYITNINSICPKCNAS